jgi:hypothetical protein
MSSFSFTCSLSVAGAWVSNRLPTLWKLFAAAAFYWASTGIQRSSTVLCVTLVKVSRTIYREASSILLATGLFKSGPRIFVVRGNLRCAFDRLITFIGRAGGDIMKLAVSRNLQSQVDA